MAAVAKTSEPGARVVMFRPKEPATGQEPVLDGKGKPVYHLNGLSEVEVEEGKFERVTSDTPGAQPLSEPWVLNPSQLFAADHPLVEKYPHLFVQTDPTHPAVETR